jgi:hypothetical protein
MYQTLGVGAGATTAGVAGVALLPNTGGFRFMFVVSVIALAIGAGVLCASAFVAFKKRAQANK